MTTLSEKLQRAVNFVAQQTGGSRSDVISRLADAVDAARSTVRQDVHGYIKQPSLDRLDAYADVLGFETRDFLRMAREDGIVYDEPWIGLKARDSARSAGDIRYDEKSDSGEWNKPTWSKWKSALDLADDATWESVSGDVRSRIAATTVFGEASADTFSDANFYPLVDPPSTLVFGALESAWSLAGKAPDPEGLRSTLETLANKFDESFEDESNQSDPQSQTEESPFMSIKTAAPEGITVDPFTEKIEEEDTEFKGSPYASVKDVDRSSNIVEVYYAAWTEDAHDERFVQGAFEDAIKKYGPESDRQRIVHLNQHMTTEPIGVPLEMREDEHGLFSRTKISETRLGEDVLTLYDDGVITEHSVGFKRVETEQQDEGPNLIKKALLLEGSNVTWGANADTPFLGFKSAEEAIPALANRLKSLRRALSSGLTDAVAKNIAHSISHVESQLRTLIDASAEAFEEEDQTNAQPLKEESLDRATRAFETQFEVLEDTADEKRPKGDGNADESSGIVTPDFDIKGDEDDDIVIPDDMTLFGGTNE